MPFRQQEQITRYLMDGLPGLLGAAFDARGNGAYLAEYAMQRYGSGRVQQVMPTEGWYRGAYASGQSCTGRRQPGGLTKG